MTTRQDAIVDAVRDGKHDPIEWSPVRSDARGHSCTFYVSSDALTIGGVRVNVTADTAQRVADILGCSLNTTRTSDCAWEQAVLRIGPCLQSAGPDMASEEAERRHSNDVDKQIAGRVGLVRDVGKDWILHPRLLGKPTLAVNYGLRDPKAPYTSWSGLRMWQTVGTRHDVAHQDYSQVLTLVRRDVLVDGEPRDFVSVLQDSELSWLLSDDGMMRVTRYPGVPMSDPNEVPREKTPIGELELAAVLRDGHHATFGDFPSQNRLAGAWAQCCLEHAHGTAVYCHNLGNVTGWAPWSGKFYSFVVPEKIDGKWKTVAQKFRAHDTFVDGAANYWDLFNHRFAPVLPHFDSGDMALAVHALKSAGYFTADEQPYAAAVKSLFSDCLSKILPRL